MGGTRPPRNLHSCSRPSVHCGFTFIFTFSHFADAFIQSDLQLRNTSEVPLTPSLRHCSNKYKLAREGEKDEDIEKGKDLHVVQTRKQCLVSYMAF